MRERINQIREKAAQYGVTKSNAAVVWIVGVMALSLVAGVAGAQSALFFDGFEDGTVLDTWQQTQDNNGDISPSTSNVYEGNYSSAMTISFGSGGDGAVEMEQNITAAPSEKIVLTYYGRFEAPSNMDYHAFNLRLSNSTDDVILVHRSEEDTESFGVRVRGSVVSNTSWSGVASDPQTHPFTEYRLVYDPDNGTVQGYYGGTLVSEGTLDTRLAGDVKLVATHVGNDNLARTATLNLDNIEVNGVPASELEPPENESLDLKHNNYMNYGETQPYVVTYENDTGRYNVTSEATVWSNNTSVVDFNTNFTMTATNDTTISARVLTHANYTTQRGAVVNDTSYVTVASVTVDNLEILPPIYRFSASITDDTIFWTIISMLGAIVFTRLSTAFGGICAYVLSFMMGWFSGYVPFGIMLTVVMTGCFLGLNLAANINYGAVGSMPGAGRLE